MVIIAISGKAESGKDTFAKLLARSFIHGVVSIRHLADNVKYVAQDVFGWDGKKDIKGRELLQLIGDGGRAYNKDIWIDKFLEQVNIDFASDVDVLLVPDVRYKNELLYLEMWAETNNAEFYSVRIERPDHENSLTPSQRNNASETSLDDYKDWDFLVENNSDLEDLAVKVEDIMEVMGID